MSLSVSACDTAAIKTKLHVEILNADVVYHLIEAALKEGGIDRANGLQSFTRHAGGKSDAVLLGNANVKRSLWKLLEWRANAGAIRHRRRQSDHLRIFLHQFRQRVAKYFRVGRRLGRPRLWFSGLEIKRTGCMPAIVVWLDLRKTLSFRCQRVDDHWSILDLFCFLQSRDQRARIVTVDVADVFETEFADERARQHSRRNHVLHGLRRVMQSLTH